MLLNTEKSRPYTGTVRACLAHNPERGSITPGVLPYVFQVVVVNFKVQIFSEKFVDPWFLLLKRLFMARKMEGGSRCRIG